jgi:hypothetical protein
MRNRPTKLHTRMAPPIGKKVPEKKEQLEALALRFATLLQSMPAKQGEQFRTYGLELIEQAKRYPYEDLSTYVVLLEQAATPGKSRVVGGELEIVVTDEHGRKWRRARDGKGTYRLPVDDTRPSKAMDRAHVAFLWVGVIARAQMLTEHLKPWLRVSDALQAAWLLADEEMTPNNRARSRYGDLMFQYLGHDEWCVWKRKKHGDCPFGDSWSKHGRIGSVKGWVVF